MISFHKFGWRLVIARDKEVDQLATRYTRRTTTMVEGDLEAILNRWLLLPAMVIVSVVVVVLT